MTVFDALPAAVEARIVPEPNTGCWLWLGHLDKDGYANTSCYRGAGVIKPHRWIFKKLRDAALLKGEPLDHKCRQRCCVNPWHLERVTPLENVRRSLPFRKIKTHCPKGHEFTLDNLRLRKGKRTRACLTCHRLAESAKYHALTPEQKSDRNRKLHRKRFACITPR